jgi:hypothetical protein
LHEREQVGGKDWIGGSCDVGSQLLVEVLHFGLRDHAVGGDALGEAEQLVDLAAGHHGAVVGDGIGCRRKIFLFIYGDLWCPSGSE